MDFRQNDGANLSSPAEHNDKAFLEELTYCTTEAHARRAGNGWGGQPIPDRTDLFRGTKSFFLRLFTR